MPMPRRVQDLPKLTHDYFHENLTQYDRLPVTYFGKAKIEKRQARLENGGGKGKKRKKKRKISYLISLLPAIRDPEKRRQPGGARGSSLSSPPPRDLSGAGSCLSSPRPRRSARPSAAAPRLRPPPGSSPWAAAPRCTWRSRAGAASRPARSGASRSAARSAVGAPASPRPRRPTWTRKPPVAGWTGKGSRWGSRCRRRRCPSCRTRRSPTSGRGPSGTPSASSCSTCGHSASSSAWLPAGLLWLRTMKGQQTSEKLLLTRNQSKRRSSQKSQNHQAPMCLKVTQLR